MSATTKKLDHLHSFMCSQSCPFHVIWCSLFSSISDINSPTGNYYCIIIQQQCGSVRWMAPCSRWFAIMTKKQWRLRTCNPACLPVPLAPTVVLSCRTRPFWPKANASKWMTFWEEPRLGNMSIEPWLRVPVAIIKKPIFNKFRFDQPMSQWACFTK